MTILPPSVKAGVVASFRGNYTTFENNMIHFLAK